ncbi:MAG: hypothetical protein WA004_20600 [Saprospiraceae bacterium]
MNLKKTILTTAKLLLILTATGIGYLNYSLYYQPRFQSYNADVYHQLKFLQAQLDDGAGDRMQNIYPEGFIFINCLYGLSWCEMIANLGESSGIYQEGLGEVSRAYREVSSPKAKLGFSNSVSPPYGVFYTGWTNYLLGRKLLATPPHSRTEEEVQVFKAHCLQISKALAESESPFLESYHGMAWPADMVIAISSLALHDRLFPPLFQSELQGWTTKVKGLLDPATGLIPHAVAPKSGATLEGARGSSQSLMLCFLKDIDEDFARQQFQLYTEYFLEKRFGLPGISEYPEGQSGRGDIDSGPVLLGIGGAASIAGQRAMGINGRWDAYEALRNSIQGFGLGLTLHAKKRYLFGKLPIADAFIAWSNSIENREGIARTDARWRTPFQLLSLAIVLMIGFLLLKLK